MTTPLMVDSDIELVNRLRLAISRLNRRIRLASNDVPPLQLSTLVTLERHGPQRSGELAAREAVTPPTMTRVLASLSDRGFIDRAPDPDDARSVRITLTAPGRAALTRIRSERTALLSARLDAIAPEQRAALVAALPALEALVDADG